MNPLRIASALIISLVWCSNTIAQVQRPGLAEIVQSSSAICIATVTEVASIQDGRGDVTTYTTFKLEEAISGKLSSTFKIKQQAGRYRNVNVSAEQVQQFKRGERVLLTLDAKVSGAALLKHAWKVDALNQVVGISPELLDSVGVVATRLELSASDGSPVKKEKFVALLKELRSSMTQENTEQ